MYLFNLHSVLLLSSSFLLLLHKCTSENTSSTKVTVVPASPEGLNKENKPFQVGDKSITEARAGFASDLYREVTSTLNDDVNRVFSPYGLNILLGMVYAGASGDTAATIREAMKLNPFSNDVIFQDYKNVSNSFKSLEDTVQLVVASQAFVKNNYSIKASYTSRLREVFNGETQVLDVTDPENSAFKINSWVEKNTNNKIKNLISSKNTKDDKFFTNPKHGEYVIMPFMENRHYFPHAIIEQLKAEAVMIPYKGKRFVMIALLPREPPGFSDLEHRISLGGFDLTSIPSIFQPYNTVELHFPKFKIESEINFIDPKEKIFENLGLLNITSSSADFSLITDDPTLHVSDVMQKTVIEITEEGTEAAAAGAAYISTYSAPPARIKFNRPFLGYIMDLETKTILFMFRKTS